MADSDILNVGWLCPFKSKGFLLEQVIVNLNEEIVS